MTETDPIITRKEFQKRLGVVSDTVRRWMRDGKLPKPDIHLSRETLGWRLSTLRAAGINLP